MGVRRISLARISVVVLASALVPPTLAAPAFAGARLTCPAGQEPLKVNGVMRCIAIPPATVTGGLSAVAGDVSSHGLLAAMGAPAFALGVADPHRSVLNDFFSNVLLRAERVAPPKLPNHTRKVAFDFPGGTFQGFKAAGHETVGSTAATKSGASRSTVMAMAFHGALPGIRSRDDVPTSVVETHGLDVAVVKCPDQVGVVQGAALGREKVVVRLGSKTWSGLISMFAELTGQVEDTAVLSDRFLWHASITLVGTGLEEDLAGTIDASTPEQMTGTDRVTLRGKNLSGKDPRFLPVLGAGTELDALARTELIAQMHAAQAFWQSGQCLDAGFSPSAPVMKPNEQLDVTVTVRRRFGAGTVRRADLLATMNPAGSVQPAAQFTDSSGEAKFKVTAPADVQTLTLHVIGVSNQGKVKGNLVICMEPATQQPTRIRAGPECTPPQPFFRVESWSSTETATGSEDSILCQVLGTDDQAKGTLDIGTTLPSPQASAPAANTLTDQGGQIDADGVQQTLSNYSTHNCSFDPQGGGEVPCDFTLPDRTASEQDGVGLLTPSGGMVPVQWPSAGANLGAVDDPCSVFFDNHLTFDEELTQVPLATFQTPGQHTITFSGSKHFDADSLGSPASIDYTWSFSLTFETVLTPGT